ncbi:MAG: patatin-like phospholipase family protein [Bacteroidota bacterium]|nr:patatin-like phospholipase family protein [Bacteroidota bacterium]
MRALVISGGGSKGAFAGGVAEYLIDKMGNDYDIYIGTSTGSLLVSHLALQKTEKLKKSFTEVTQEKIFDNCPFKIKKNGKEETISINHFNVLKNFIRGKKTFGESNNLRKTIEQEIRYEDFIKLKKSNKEVFITVSNLSRNKVEYKRLKNCSFSDYLDWIWISCNYVPFMSLAVKEGCEYADGGLGTIISIEEAIRIGSTYVDVIILDTEFQYTNRVHSRNAFQALTTVFGFMTDKIERQNIEIGKLLAHKKKVKINFYYTPRILTSNSLIFEKEKMKKWWTEGFNYAKIKLSET